ncbi:hypothetical protein ACLBXM_17795 [Xanthobacteraceae bacterium A53D]
MTEQDLASSEATARRMTGGIEALAKLAARSRRVALTVERVLAAHQEARR